MTTTLSSKGQIVLPSAARRRLGLLPGASFKCSVEGGRIILSPEGPAVGRPRLVKSKRTGLVYAEQAKGAPQVTRAQIAAIMADFP
jgi:AbrB family looped-hinge helix DNA binding protein